MPPAKQLPALLAPLGILKGLQLCLTLPAVRRLSLWPWIVGIFSYFISFAVASYLHDPLARWMSTTREGTWGSVINYSAEIAASLLLFVFAVLFSVVLVLIFTAVFQTNIARAVLDHFGRAVPLEEPGVKALLSQTLRSIGVETVKLFWIVPLTLASLLLGWVPLLLPVSLFLSAWLLGYNFIDIPLDLYGTGAGYRLRYAWRHKLAIAGFGAGLLLCFAVPFVGIILAPAATAGAAWVLYLLPDSPRA